MRVTITRIDTSLPLPSYETTGSAGFDFVTREKTIIPPGMIGLIPGNVIVKVPKGYVLLIIPRSSLPRKKALVCPHSIGVIDQDYCGEKDEILIQVQNVSQEHVVVERGERIAQGLFVRVDAATWNEGAADRRSRGGFGSTDKKLTSSLRQNRTRHVRRERNMASSAG